MVFAAILGYSRISKNTMYNYSTKQDCRLSFNVVHDLMSLSVKDLKPGYVGPRDPVFGGHFVEGQFAGIQSSNGNAGHNQNNIIILIETGQLLLNICTNILNSPTVS